MTDQKSSETQEGTSSSSGPDRPNAHSMPNLLHASHLARNGHHSASTSNMSSIPHDHSWGVLAEAVPGSLRPVIIDGSNVAMQLGRRVFATRGILICARHFISRGHQVITFVPQFRRTQRQDNFKRPMIDQHLLDWMSDRDLLIYTPSRMIHVEDSRQRIVCYDDFNIVDYAHRTGGVIVSKDQYRDVLLEHPEWAPTVQNRLIMFSWAGELFMPAEDPFGRRGPRLENVLQYGANEIVAPLPTTWTVEKRKQLLSEIDEILAAPPPPQPPPYGSDFGESSGNQESGHITSSDALPSYAVPRQGFIRRDNSGNYGGFNHRSRNWMQKSAQPGSELGFAPLPNGGWPSSGDPFPGFGSNGSTAGTSSGSVSFGLGGDDLATTSTRTRTKTGPSSAIAPFLEWFEDRDFLRKLPDPVT